MITLAENRIIKRDLGQKLIEYTLLKNRLARKYHHVTTEELLKKARELSKKLVPEFINWLHKMAT